MSKLVNTSKEQIIIHTKSPVSDYFYNDFVKVLKAYLKELKNVNIENAKMSSSDFSVLNDIVQEANEYTLLLFRSNYNNQSFELNELVQKVVTIFMIVFKNLFMDQEYSNKEIELSPNQLLKFPYLLKLTYLETKLQLLIGLCIKQAPVSEQTTDECTNILNEILTIQSNLNIPKYYVGCSLFYRASLSFILGNAVESLQYSKEALSLIEDRSIESIIEDTNTPEFDEKFTIKISSVIDFIGNLHEYQKEFANALRYYEKAYYLNLGKFGMSKPQTEYFKSKINSLKGFENHSKNNTLNTITYDRSSFANIIKTENVQNEVIADVEGDANHFSYRAKYTHIYEPLMITIFANSREFSLYFDKSELIKFFNLRGNNSNKLLYSLQTINNIISKLSFDISTNTVMVLDPLFKQFLIC